MIYYRGSDLLPLVFLVPQGPLGFGHSVNRRTAAGIPHLIGRTLCKFAHCWKREKRPPRSEIQLYFCDPKVLLQGPETSKVPKVVRRGCKRSFGPRAPKASCTGAKESCTSAKQGFGGAKDSWETFAPWVQNTFCTLS